MSLIIGILTLPLFLWSWLVRKNEEDGELAISLIACLVIGGVALAAGWWALA